TPSTATWKRCGRGRGAVGLSAPGAAGSVDERLVDHRRELLAQVGAVRNELEHQHHHEPRFGIDPVDRTVGAAPAEGADRIQFACAEAVGSLETVAVAEPAGLPQIANLVRRHQPDGTGAEQPLAFVDTPAPDHLEEPRVVVRGRQEARSAGVARTWAVDICTLAGRTVVGTHGTAVGSAR